MNDWNEKLEYSLSAQQQFDISLLKMHLPHCTGIRKTTIEQDKKGVDYIATLKGGAEILIDAKTRTPGSKQYWKNGEAELALETWSVVNKKLGWTLSDKTNVDYILFTFAPTEWDKYYFFPFQLLRKAFIANGKQWAEKYSRKVQFTRSYNGCWQSEAIFVPASVVVQAVSDTLRGDMPKRNFIEKYIGEELEVNHPLLRAILGSPGYSVIGNKMYFMGTFLYELHK